MTTYTIANISDALFGLGWAFDTSNFLTAPVGTGINIGAPANPDQANSVNVLTNYYVGGSAADASFAPIASPTFTGTATFATLTAATANVTTCEAANYELNGVNIKSGRALTQAIDLIPSGFKPTAQVYNQFVGLNQTITPAVTGLIYVLLSGQMAVPVVSGSGVTTVYYGTGTPPAQGQYLVNTPNYTELWQDVVVTPLPVDAHAGNMPFTAFLFFQGTVGTQYWVDMQIAPFEFGPLQNGTILNVNLFLVEV